MLRHLQQQQPRQRGRDAAGHIDQGHAPENDLRRPRRHVGGLQLQRYGAAGWVTMTEDRGCVTVQRAQLELGSPSGVFVGAGVCAAPLAANATTAGGRAWLALPATPGAAPGRLAVRVAGTAASGNACSPVGAVQAVSSLNMPWLTGGTAGAGPLATATWGTPQRDLVLRREIW